MREKVDAKFKLVMVITLVITLLVLLQLVWGCAPYHQPKFNDQQFGIVLDKKGNPVP